MFFEPSYFRWILYCRFLLSYGGHSIFGFLYTILLIPCRYWVSECHSAHNNCWNTSLMISVDYIFVNCSGTGSHFNLTCASTGFSGGSGVQRTTQLSLLVMFHLPEGCGPFLKIFMCRSPTDIEVHCGLNISGTWKVKAEECNNLCFSTTYFGVLYSGKLVVY